MASRSLAAVVLMGLAPLAVDRNCIVRYKHSCCNLLLGKIVAFLLLRGEHMERRIMNSG